MASFDAGTHTHTAHHEDLKAVDIQHTDGQLLLVLLHGLVHSLGEVTD